MDMEDDVIAGRLEKSADQNSGGEKKKLAGCNFLWQNLDWKQRSDCILKGGTGGSKEFHSIPKLKPKKTEKKVHYCESFISTGIEKNNFRIYSPNYYKCHYEYGVYFLLIDVINIWLKHWFNFLLSSKSFVMDDNNILHPCTSLFLMLLTYTLLDS